MKNMSLTAHGLGKPPPKASNSSKIRARSMQNTSQKNSRNVTFETHKKNMSITAHGLGSMQNTSLKNFQNVTKEQLYRRRWCPSG